MVVPPVYLFQTLVIVCNRDLCRRGTAAGFDNPLALQDRMVTSVANLPRLFAATPLNLHYCNLVFEHFCVQVRLFVYPSLSKLQIQTFSQICLFFSFVFVCRKYNGSSMVRIRYLHAFCCITSSKTQVPDLHSSTFFVAWPSSFEGKYNWLSALQFVVPQMFGSTVHKHRDLCSHHNCLKDNLGSFGSSHF